MTEGLGFSLAYSFTRAESLFDGRGFINATNWRNTASINGRNNPMVGRLDLRCRLAPHRSTVVPERVRGLHGHNGFAVLQRTVRRAVLVRVTGEAIT